MKFLSWFAAPASTEFRKWKPLADQGDAAAQLILGIMYKDGKGVPQNSREAACWYRLAADQGDVMSQYSLGIMYAKGMGVPQDSREATRWYRLAAKQGDAAAQYNLGIMYDKGEGVPQDYVQAHMWLNLAAAQGYKESSDARDQVAGEMSQSQIEEAQRLAREWKPKK